MRKVVDTRRINVDPQISIVTLNYNQRRYLSECIESILTQSVHSWELVIVDPGSTDDSQTIYDLYAHDPRIIVHREQDAGPADGLNNGLRRVKSKLFGYLNADDRYLHRDVFAEVIEEFRRRPQASVIVGHGYQIDAGGRMIRELISDRFSARSYVLGTSVSVQQSTFFRIEVVRSVGGFNSDNRISWDGELLFDICTAGYAIARCSKHWGGFRIYPGTITMDPTTRLKGKATRERLFVKMHGRRPNVVDSIERCCRRAMRDLSSPSIALARVNSKIDHVRHLGQERSS